MVERTLTEYGRLDVAFACRLQPPHVDVNELVILPTAQDF